MPRVSNSLLHNTCLQVTVFHNGEKIETHRMEARACGTRPGNDKTPLPFIPSFSSNTNRAQCPCPCPCPHTPLPPPPPRPTRGLVTLLAARHASLNWFGEVDAPFRIREVTLW